MNADKIIDELSDQDCVAFWKSVKKLNRSRLLIVNSGEYISSEFPVVEAWLENYKSILNSVDQNIKIQHNFEILILTVVCMFVELEQPIFKII